MGAEQHRIDALMIALYDHDRRPATELVVNRIAATWRRIELHATRKPEGKRVWS